MTLPVAEAVERYLASEGAPTNEPPTVQHPNLIVTDYPVPHLAA